MPKKKEKHEPKTWKHELYKVELLAVTMIILALGISYFQPSLTGFAGGDPQRETLNLQITNSQVYNIFTDNETAQLLSFGITGTTAGDGAIYIYLDNLKGDSKLVYTNVRNIKDTGGASLITGLITVEKEGDIDRNVPLEDDEVALTGPFVNDCIETCFLDTDFANDKYNLVMLVEPGAVLTIDEIIYLFSP